MKIVAKAIAGIKQSMGRILPAEDVLRCQRSETVERGHGTYRSRISYSLKGGNPIVRMTELEFMSTPDASHGWVVFHRGHYPVSVEIMEYNADARLVRRSVSRMNHAPYYVGKIAAYEYDPPGSFWGRPLRT